MKLKNRLLLVLFLGLVFISGSGFTIVGHRGDPSKYPEETIQSDNSAFHSGADYVELDVHLTKDKVLVVSHDDDLTRVTHIHAIVTQNTFNTLHNLSYDNGEHVLSLNELFAHYQKQPAAKFVLETKINHSIDHSYQLEDKLAQVIKQYHMQKRVMIHSFSAASLFYLHKLMPKAYLILIVGSLKRINFSNLPQINAVNVSSNVIMNHSWLIHWLHLLHKEVYVWTEMDESPDLWQWLINKNVDGVVTNFPATGFKYKLAKAGTHKYEINQTGIYFGKTKARTVINPYVPVKQAQTVKPGTRLNVTYGVQTKKRLYYQIAPKTFINSEFVNLNLTKQDIAPYADKQILTKPEHNAPLYRYPNRQSRLNKTLPANRLLKIQNFNGSPKTLWLYTNCGWVRAKDILFYGFFDQQSFAAYNKLERLSRYQNIAVLPYRPAQVKQDTFYDLLKKTNHITN